MDRSSDLQFKVFDWLRFPLIVGVVFIHCFGKPFDYDALDFTQLSEMDYYNLFRVSISHVSTHICVPTFYLISGYLALLNISTILVKNERLKIPVLWSKASFFIYLVHTILVIRVVTWIAHKVFGEVHPLLMAMSYLFVPISTISICLGIYYLLNKYVPALCSVLTGDR